MRKAFLLIIILMVLGFCLYFWQKVYKIKNQKEISTMINLAGKKAVMIVASEDFRDEEYFEPKEVLENRGVEIKTASDKVGMAKGAGGKQTKVDLLVSDVNSSEFDAVIFIGGPGALAHLDNEFSYNLAKSAVEQKKILAAICISPVILAKAGVLKEKQATVWSSPLDRSSIEILKENGAKYNSKAVVVDGKIITANGPSAAKQFGEKIVEKLIEGE